MLIARLQIQFPTSHLSRSSSRFDNVICTRHSGPSSGLFCLSAAFRDLMARIRRVLYPETSAASFVVVCLRILVVMRLCIVTFARYVVCEWPEGEIRIVTVSQV